jgi:hypothetical protein
MTGRNLARSVSTTLLIAAFTLFWRSAPGVAAEAAAGVPLRSLRKIYLSMHQGCWADCTPSDPRRKTRLWEQFPGRCELAYRLDLRVQERVLRLIRDAKEDEGILIVPNDLNNAPERAMIALAKQKFGRRAVVCDWRQPADFKKGLEEDRREAVRRRGPNWESPQSSPPGAEFEAWANAKRMAASLRMQLEEQGYTFDPATVEVVSFGDDWMGCAATYPIHIAGAWDLARGVDRRFDLGISDESLLCLKLEPVEQNLPMPENVRLFIFKAPNEPPAWGRYVAQFWEGKHHVRDLPHLVTVDFPPGTVRVVNTDGLELTFSLGIHRPYNVGGRIEMGVGCGGHTPYPPTLVRAEEGLSLKDFRAALLAGKVSKRTP